MTGKRIFLTGASAGIGLATARALVAEEHQVWGTSRDVTRLPSLAGLRPVELDLTESDSIRAAATRVLAESGGIDVLVNNGGSGVFGALESFDARELQQQFQLLVFGPMELTRLVLPHMRREKAGLIVNVTSLAAAFPVPFLGGYSAAKAALSALGASLQLELANTGIRVIDVRPGDIRSEFHERMRRAESEVDVEYAPGIDTVHASMAANARTAPASETVARAVVKLVSAGERAPARVTIGDFFQARLSPLGARLLPYGLLQAMTMRYHGLRPGRG